MRRAYFTLDVFTHRRFAGNPLAVVLEPQGLDDAAMQTVAREFNLSETVFVFPPADPGRRADLRIFTPGRELPFAGHPTVGAAVLLALLDRSGRPGQVAFTLGEKVGPVRCLSNVTSATGGDATFTLPRLPERVSDLPDPATLAAALGIAARDIGAPGLSPAVWSAGVAFAVVPLAARAALDRAYPVLPHWEKAFGPAGGAAFVVAAEPEEPGHAWSARMFSPTFGIMEDPATGAAAAAFAGFLANHVVKRDGAHRIVVEQGYRMGRPSQIVLTLTTAQGALVTATIGGGAVIVSEGHIEA